MTASIAPAGQGVAVALGSPTVATGSSATLTVSATAGAVPGSYTATITGTLGSSTHSTTIPVTVLPATGIPGLLQAVPGIEATDGLSGSMTDNPGLANGLWIAGMLNGTSGTPFSLTLLTASSCPGGILPADATTVDTLGAALSGTIGTDGTAYFGGLLHITPGSLSSFIAARVGSGPVGPCIVVSPPNDQWVTALDISGKTGTGDATNGYIDQPGVARWYKFTVSPGTHLHIALSNLPADYDVFLFKDISQAYTDLTASNVTASGGASSLLNLNKLSAEFASADVANAFTSNAFTSNAFTSNAFTSNAFTSNAFTSNAFTSNAFTSNAFTSNAFTSNAFTSNAFTSNAFTSNAFTSNAFTSNAFTSNAFTSNAFTSNAFTSSSTFNPYGVDLSAYSSAQVRSVIAGSANLGLAPETIDGNTWTNSGTYYIRVNGKGSASSLAGAFSLSVTESGNLCNPVVAAQQSNAVLGPDSFTAPTGQNAATLVLWDSSRIPGSAASVATLSSTLQTFASQSQIRGAVVDLSTFNGSARINALNALADANTGCVYAKNLVASAIKDVVTAYRKVNPDLKYIVLVGGDNVIPFFRYPDQNGLGPESNYIPPVDPLTASEASLQSDYVLGQDDYGASIDLSLGNYAFPVPDLAVGRLVETASEATGILNAYLNHTTAGVVAPNDGNGSATAYSSLVTGYDFLADDATTVKSHLAAGTGVTPDSLIAQPKSTTPWTGADLKAALTNQRHDLVFLAGHFSSSLALAADFTTYMQTTDLVNSSVDLTNTIVFSAGCHSGYNLVDGDQVPGVTQPLDWAQAFAQKGATLIGGTGYQYGDSDFELWSERIYAEFAHQLDSGSGPVAIGDALMRSKQIYLSSTPDVLPMDAKALLESTLYGLPMLSVDMPGRENQSTTPPAIGGTPTARVPRPRADLGLTATSDVTVQDTDDTRVQVARQRRCQRELDRHAHDRDLAHRRQRRRRQPGPAGPPAPDGRRDRRRQGPPRRRVQERRLYRPDWGRPAHRRARHRALHRAPGICFPGVSPEQPFRINYFGALTPGGPTSLLLTPAQYKSSPSGDGTAILRTYQSLGLQLFYSSNISDAAQASAPSIGNVSAVLNGSTITFQATVTENPAGIQGVWVTWTGAGTGGSDAWQSIDLTEDPSSKALWTGTMPAPANTANFQFMAQAVNGVGLVGLDDNFGAYYRLTSAAVATAAPAPTHLALSTSNPTSGTYKSTVTVSAALTSGTNPVGNEPITFTIDAATKVATTDAQSGVATATLPLSSLAGATTLSASFPGDGSYALSGDAHPFTINRIGTSLTLSTPGAAIPIGFDSGVVATLKDANGLPIPYRNIIFIVTGPVNTARVLTTDAAGQTPLGIVPSVVGGYNVTACFDGPAVTACPSVTVHDPTYGASGATGSFTVGVASANMVTVQLKDSLGNPLSGGTASYYASGWHTIGVTSNGQVSTPILPGSYSFSMTYNGMTQQFNKVAVSGSLTTVTFQTRTVAVQLKNSSGALSDTGSASYYASGWHTIGNTSGGVAHVEMLPGSYSFAMTYNGTREQLNSVSVLTNPTTVTFNTIDVVAQLKSSSGALMDTGGASYYASGWHTIGNTSGGVAHVEMLPGSYSFAMTYNGTREQQNNVSVSTNPTVVLFQTTDVAVQLHDSSDAPLDTGTASYYASGWHTIGDTAGGVIDVEMLPGSYSFAMTYNGTRQQINRQAVSGASTVVPFQTTGVAVNLIDSSGAPLDPGGTASYYASGWHTIGNTSGGVIDVEMLPGSYSFAMTYLGTRGQLNSQAVSGTSSSVTFQTGSVHSDAGSATSYYASGWKPFTQDMQLLPGTYTFSFSDTGNASYSVAPATVNHIH